MKTILTLLLGLATVLACGQSQEPILSVAQVMPEYPGGEDSIYAFLHRNLHYPMQASDSMIQGKVVVAFTVNADGSLSDILVKRHVHPLLDAEAIRVVKTFPAFTPGYQNDKPVRVSSIVPISFKINVIDTTNPEFVLPVFPGGDQVMRDFIQSNIRHTGGVAGFLGKVPVAFEVDTNGKVSKIHAKIAMSDAIDSEALRIVSLFPRFQSAMRKGKKVFAQVALDVSFFDEKYVLDSNGFYNGTVLDEGPSFIGGKAKKKEFYEKYFLPSEAIRNRKHMLYAQFTCNADSSVTDIKVSDTISASMSADIKNGMQHLLKFSPGVYKGKAVKTRVYFVIDSLSSSVAGPAFETMPQFPGGEEAMMRCIQRNINYPEKERENDIQGRVIVGFLINEKGKKEDVKIKKGVSPGLDKEALRVVNLLPDFIPGTQQGKPVAVSFVLPIMFMLASQ